MFTNVQWNCAPQNLNLHRDRERVATGQVARIRTSCRRRVGKTFTKAINCNFLNNDAARQRGLGRSRQ
jgi:hypothetical protein